MQNITPALSWNFTVQTHEQQNEENNIESITIAVLAIFISLLCIIGNVFVLVILVRNDTLRVVTNGFIASIALSDLLTAMINIPFSIVALLKHKWIFGKVFCQISSFSTGAFSVSSTMSITYLTVDRYLSFENSSRKKTSTNIASFLIGISVIIAISISSPWYLIGGISDTCTELNNQLMFQHCIYQPVCKENGFWTVFLKARFLICFVCPFLLMVFCTGCIGKTLYTSRRQVGPIITNANDVRFSAEVKTAITVLIIFGVHSLFSIPFLINETVVHLTHGIVSDTPFDNICILLLWLNKAVNPVIYVIRNPYFGKFFFWKRRQDYITNCKHSKDPRGSYLVDTRTGSLCCDGGQRNWVHRSISNIFNQRHSVSSDIGFVTDTTAV